MKHISKLLVVILVISILIPIVSLAINAETEADSKEFFTSDKTQGYQGETVTLTLDLSLNLI